MISLRWSIIQWSIIQWGQGMEWEPFRMFSETKNFSAPLPLISPLVQVPLPMCNPRKYLSLHFRQLQIGFSFEPKHYPIVSFTMSLIPSIFGPPATSQYSTNQHHQPLLSLRYRSPLWTWIPIQRQLLSFPFSMKTLRRPQSPMSSKLIFWGRGRMRWR